MGARAASPSSPSHAPQEGRPAEKLRGPPPGHANGRDEERGAKGKTLPADDGWTIVGGGDPRGKLAREAEEHRQGRDVEARRKEPPPEPEGPIGSELVDDAKGRARRARS